MPQLIIRQQIQQQKIKFALQETIYFIFFLYLIFVKTNLFQFLSLSNT